MVLRTTLQYNDGTDEDVRVLGKINCNNSEYIVFLADRRKDPINYVYRIIKSKKDKMTIEYVEDREEFEMVCKAIMRQVQKAGVSS